MPSAAPKWEASLRRQAKLRNTHSSTAIEGNKLTLEQVEALSEGKDVIAPDRDKKEALNYLEALDAVHSFTDKGNIRVEDLLNIHRMVSKDVLRDNKHSGVFRNRQPYYTALKTAQDNNNDITEWLEYFATGVAYSVNEVKEAILKLGSKKKRVSKAQISLTDKQMKIVEFINTHGRATNKDLQALFKISAQAVHKELAKIVELKVIKPLGAGGSLYYVLA